MSRKKIDIVGIGHMEVMDCIVHGRAPRTIDELMNWKNEVTLNLCGAGSLGYCVQALSKLGARVGLIGDVANDVFGRILIETYRACGVDTSRVGMIEDAVTPIALYLLLWDDKKRPLLKTARPKAPPWRTIFSEEDLDYIAHAKMIFESGYLHNPKVGGKPTIEVFRFAKDNGLISCLDPQWATVLSPGKWLTAFQGLLTYVDVLLLDEDEARNIAGCSSLKKASEKLVTLGPKIVAVKMGKDGCLVRTEERIVHVPSFKMDKNKIFDAIGAGDAFDAGFLIGVLEKWDLETTARFANAVAYFSLLGPGGASSIPPRDVIENFLAEKMLLRLRKL